MVIVLFFSAKTMFSRRLEISLHALSHVLRGSSGHVCLCTCGWRSVCPGHSH